MRCFSSLLMLGLLAVSASATAVEPTFGHVDGYSFDPLTQDLIVEGWVCQRNNSNPIGVHIYAGGPFPAGTFLDYDPTADEPAHLGETFPGCGGDARRFKVALSPAERATFQGQTLYAYAFPSGSNSPMLDGSGVLRVPHRISAAVADGVTDVTDVINGEIALGGVTYIPAGPSGKPYLVTDRCIVPNCETSPPGSNKDRRVLRVPSGAVSPVEVILDGTLFLAAHTNSGSTGYDAPFVRQLGVIQVANSSSNITISGRGTIDGNSSNQSECCIGGVVVGGPALAPYSSGISNVTVRGITIRNTYQWPVTVDGANNVTLRDLKIYGGGNSVQFAHGTTNAHAYDLHIEDIHDIGFAFYNNVSYSSIENSVILDAGGAGIGVHADTALPCLSGQTDPCDDGQPLPHHISVTGNEIHRSRSGVEVLNANVTSGLSLNFSDVTISNNKSHASLTHSYGINSCIGCTVSGNYSEGSGSGGKDITQIGRYVSGLYLSESQNVTISGNTFANEGQGVNAYGYGAIIYTAPADHITTSNIVFSGNKFVDLQSTGTMAGLVAQAGPAPQAYTMSNSTDCGVLASPNTCTNVP